MARRRTVSLLAIGLVGALIALVGSPPALARWNIHNDADVTQMTAPPGGTEDQTCPDRLRGETGWSTFIPADQDPSTFVPPPQAYGPSSYTVWKAPPGFTNFNGAAEVTNDLGEVIGYEFTDASGNVSQATRLLQFTTTDRTAVSPPIPIDVAGPDGGLYVFTTAPISVPLPSSVAPGDALGLLPPGGSTILDLSVIECSPFTASGMSISVVKQQRFTRTVATFTGPGSASDYTAAIRWGDGTNRSVGTIGVGSNGFIVAGTHKYQQRGCYLIRVRITQNSTGIIVRTLSRATVRSTT